MLNFGGQNNELWCEGGEIRFVTQLIGESVQYAERVLWFTSLVSKASNLPGIEAALKKSGAKAVRIIEMGQGQKQSRMVAWSFLDDAARQAWHAQRKSQA